MIVEIEKNFVINSDLANIIWDLSPIIIALIDEDGNFLYVNRTGQDFLEYTESELKGMKWQDVTHPADLGADTIMHQMLKEKKKSNYKMCKRYITKTGRVIWGNMTVHMTHSRDNRIIFFLSQVIPMDIRNESEHVPAQMMNEENPHHNEDDEIIKKREERFELGNYIKRNITSILSLVFVVVGGIYVFSGDLAANKQKIVDMENRIVKVERSIENMAGDMKERTDNIDRNINDVVKILMDMKKNKEENDDGRK